MMTIREPHLPDFKSPPVVETVFGVSFPPLSGWRIPHYGLFWTQVKGEYPRIDVQPPITFQIEKFGADERIPVSPSIELINEPEVRCWFIDPSESKLLQVQRDGFLHNWRKMQSREPYPHYETIRPAFERDWRTFVLFLEQNHISLPVLSQCEVSYINHIERGPLWKGFGDLPSMFPTLSVRGTGAFLPEPDGVGFTARYGLPNGRGRLRVSMAPSIRHSDGKDVIDFRLTARGRPASSSIEDVLDWFDLGREWIVRGFADLTSSKAHDYWQRTQ